jgi:T4 bacteriophage base plate protein
MSDKVSIPTPKNLKPGDNFYESISSVKGAEGQQMAFEPPAELVEIPSHGYLYKDITDDPDILEKGGIRVRPMTVHEEKILSTPRLIKSGQALDLLFANVIKSAGKNGEPLDPSALLSSDRVFIMLWLRSVSYGNVYKFQITCPNNACQKRFEHEVDLSTHPIREMTDPDIKEPFEIILPISKYRLLFRLPRGKDELEIIKMQNQPKKMNETDDTIVKRLSSVIIKAYDPNQAELPRAMIDSFIESLIAGDASYFREELIKLDSGIEDIKGITCPHCDYEFDTPIPITENFFRSTR